MRCGSTAATAWPARSLMKEFGKKITIEPLIGFTVDQGPRRRHGASSSPPTSRSSPTSSPTTPRRPTSACQTPEQRDRYDDTTKCILCAACTTACPITWTNEELRRPGRDRQRRTASSTTAAIEGAAERLRILNTAVRRLALPHDLQLHRGLPARHQSDQDHRRREADLAPGAGVNRSAVEDLHPPKAKPYSSVRQALPSPVAI